jgi:hypothetical protein
LEATVAIPEDVLQTWSLRGGRFQPAWTTAVVKEALDAGQRMTGLTYRIIEQGSYPNKTNISNSSDIDLVIQLRLPFEEQIDALRGKPAYERFWAKYTVATYSLTRFRTAVLATLRERYFADQGRKCIDIRDWDSLLRVPADVVAALEYRQYRSFPAIGPEDYEEGVFFRDGHGRAIINFPEQHLVNGARKDRACGGRFKPMVRLFKNARLRCEHLPEEAKKPDNVKEMPSYFVECLVYNIHDDVIRQPMAAAYPACLTWLERNVEKMHDFICVNGITRLFGKHHVWTPKDAEIFVSALRLQWNEWPPA